MTFRLVVNIFGLVFTQFNCIYASLCVRCAWFVCVFNLFLSFVVLQEDSMAFGDPAKLVHVFLWKFRLN